MAETLDIEIYQGDTFRRTLTLLDSDDQPLDLTDYTFLGQIRRTVDSEVVLATFDTTIVDAANGEVEIRLEADVTELLPVPSTAWAWDFESQSNDASPVITTHYRGEVTVEKEVSR
jgi:hypothetical protein